MAKRVQLIRHDAAVASAFVGLEGEVTVDLDNDNLVLHDGALAGGHPVARKDLSTSPVASTSAAGKMSAAQVTSLNAATAIVTSLEKGVGGFLIKSISGPVSLTDAEADNLFLQFTGTLAADAAITFPDARGIHYVSNRTTGGFNITCKTASGASVITVPPNQTRYFMTDNASTKEFFPIVDQFYNRGRVKGCSVDYVDTDTVIVNSGSAIDQTGNHALVLPIATNCDFAVSGAGGLDTGSIVAGNAGYYIYLIGKSTDHTAISTLASLSNSSPTMPSGWDVKIIIMFVETKFSAAEIKPFANKGAYCRYQQGIQTFTSGNPNLTGVLVGGSSNGVPADIAESVTIRVYMSIEILSTSSFNLIVGNGIDGIPPAPGSSAFDLVLIGSPDDWNTAENQFDIPISDNSDISYRLDSTNAVLTLSAWVKGFRLDRDFDQLSL